MSALLSPSLASVKLTGMRSFNFSGFPLIGHLTVSSWANQCISSAFTSKKSPFCTTIVYKCGQWHPLMTCLGFPLICKKFSKLSKFFHDQQTQYFVMIKDKILWQKPSPSGPSSIHYGVKHFRRDVRLYNSFNCQNTVQQYSNVHLHMGNHAFQHFPYIKWNPLTFSITFPIP